MNREQISALMDGELEDAQAQALCAQMKSEESCECWAAFHLIGDALRSECIAQAGFARRFSERLASEPTVLAPRHAAAANSFGLPSRAALRSRPWYYGMAAAASVAAVSVVGWFGVQEFSLGPALSEQAAASARMGIASIATNAKSTTALSRKSQTPALDPYLLVHQEYSPATAMQGVRPYVRTVADVTAAE
jgi:sigma-E factor negative regulatory protein RseA